jgi:hypothetical protein
MTIKLSNAAIRDIFKLRSQGLTYKKIAERYPCSDKYIRDIIHREIFSDVVIDAETLAAVRNVKVKYEKRKKKAAAKPDVAPSIQYEPIAKLMDAQSCLNNAYKECVKAGISDAFMSIALDEVGRVDL